MSSKMGRPTNDPKQKRFTLRLSDNTYKTLEECSERLNVSKSEVIHKGIELVKKELDEKK